MALIAGTDISGSAEPGSALAGGAVRCFVGETSNTLDAANLAAPASSVAAGYGHRCVLLVDGTVQCGSHGSPLSSRVPGLADVTQVVAAMEQACALRRDGTVRCWSPGGALQTPAVSRAIAMAMGGYLHTHACALLDEGSIRCWGDNQSGQLGDGTTTPRSTPVRVVW